MLKAALHSHVLKDLKTGKMVLLAKTSSVPCSSMQITKHSGSKGFYYENGTFLLKVQLLKFNVMLIIMPRVLG